MAFVARAHVLESFADQRRLALRRVGRERLRRRRDDRVAERVVVDLVLGLPRGERAVRIRDQSARAFDPRRAGAVLGERHRPRVIDQHRDPIRLARDLAELDRRLEKHDERDDRGTGAQPDHQGASPRRSVARRPPCEPDDGDHGEPAEREPDSPPRRQEHPAVVVELRRAGRGQPHGQCDEPFTADRTAGEQRRHAERRTEPAATRPDDEHGEQRERGRGAEQAVADERRKQRDVHRFGVSAGGITIAGCCAPSSGFHRRRFMMNGTWT